MKRLRLIEQKSTRGKGIILCDGLPKFIYMEILGYCDYNSVFALVQASHFLSHWTRNLCLQLTLPLGRKIIRCGKIFHNMQALNVASCFNLDDTFAPQMCSLMPKLTRLSFSGCNRITNQTVQYLATLPQLRHLDLSYCSGLTDDCLRDLGRIQCLESLSLLCCGSISDDGLRALLPLRALQQLDLSYTLVTDTGLIQAVAKLQALVSLYLCGCNCITPFGLEPLYLQSIDIQFCARSPVPIQL